MDQILKNILTFSYACVGVIAAIGYFPTISDLWRHNKMSANISSYVIWVGCSAVSLLYGIFILPDPLFIMVTGLSFFCCLLILLLALRLKAAGRVEG